MTKTTQFTGIPFLNTSIVEGLPKSPRELYVGGQPDTSLKSSGRWNTIKVRRSVLNSLEQSERFVGYFGSLLEQSPTHYHYWRPESKLFQRINYHCAKMPLFAPDNFAFDISGSVRTASKIVAKTGNQNQERHMKCTQGPQ